jgi:hypothetical protein
MNAPGLRLRGGGIGAFGSHLDMNPQCGAQLACDGSVARGRRAWARDHKDVLCRNERMLMVSEEFTDQSFDPISHHGTAHFPAGGNANARAAAPPRFGNDDKVFSCSATTDLLKPNVLDAFASAPSSWQPLVKWPRTQRGCFGGMLTVSRFRPLARRRFSTCRPPGVAIRARKPCVRFRRLLLG